jgi:hypothetical protein
MNAIASGSAKAERSGALRATAVTAAIALVVNLVIYAIATVISDVPDRFTPLQPGSVAFMTILGVAAAGGLLALLRSRVSDPTATFRRVVPIALALSLIPDVLIWVSDAYDGAAGAKTVLPLMVMHVATAAICWIVLPSQTGEAR